MFEYLAQVQSAVRRINYRMQTLVDNLGYDNRLVGNMASKMQILFGDNMRFKDGKPQLFKPSEIYNDEELRQNIYEFDRDLKTWGAYKKQFSEDYEAYKKEYADYVSEMRKNKVKPSDIEKPLSMGEFISEIEELPQALVFMYSSRYEESEKAIQIMKTSGRRKTYGELRQAVKLAKSGEQKRLQEVAGSYGINKYRR